MQLKVKGQSDYVSHKELLYATHYMTSVLMGKKKKKLLDEVKVDLVQAPRKSYRGVLWIKDNPTLPRHFQITLDSKLYHADHLAALGHELVHMRQYLLGELKDVPEGTTWKGKLFSRRHMRGNHYWFLPWEVEASGHEVGLMALYEQARFDLFMGGVDGIPDFR